MCAGMTAVHKHLPFGQYAQYKMNPNAKKNPVVPQSNSWDGHWKRNINQLSNNYSNFNGYGNVDQSSNFTSKAALLRREKRQQQNRHINQQRLSSRFTIRSIQTANKKSGVPLHNQEYLTRDSWKEWSIRRPIELGVAIPPARVATRCGSNQS